MICLNVMKRGILTGSPLHVVSQPLEKLVIESRKFCSVAVCARERGWQSHPLDSQQNPTIVKVNVRPATFVIFKSLTTK